MSDKKHSTEFQEKFDQLDVDIYTSFIEAGWIIPQTEEEVKIAEETLQKVQIPPLPAGVKDSSPLIAQIRREREERQKSESSVKNIFKGILARAKDLGMSSLELAKQTDLTVALITKLDLGLITNYHRIPLDIVKDIANELRVDVQDLYGKWVKGPRFAEGVEFKANDVPEIEGQDFFEAVREDRTFSDARRNELLAMEEKL